jgi:hypothetical protein
MPAPRSGAAQWPTTGEQDVRCILQYATPTTDAMGGRGEPTWTQFATWWAKALTVPFIKSDVDSSVLYKFEGRYVALILDHFTGGVGVRLLANGLTLKVFQVENPQLQNRTLIVHAANAVTTQ